MHCEDRKCFCNLGFQQGSTYPKHTRMQTTSWFKITRTSFMEGPRAQSQTLNQLKRCGVMSKMLFLRQRQLKMGWNVCSLVSEVGQQATQTWSSFYIPFHFQSNNTFYDFFYIVKECLRYIFLGGGGGFINIFSFVHFVEQTAVIFNTTVCRRLHHMGCRTAGVSLATICEICQCAEDLSRTECDRRRYHS